MRRDSLKGTNSCHLIALRSLVQKKLPFITSTPMQARRLPLSVLFSMEQEGFWFILTFREKAMHNGERVDEEDRASPVRTLVD